MFFFLVRVDKYSSNGCGRLLLQQSLPQEGLTGAVARELIVNTVKTMEWLLQKHKLITLIPVYSILKQNSAEISIWGKFIH